MTSPKSYFSTCCQLAQDNDDEEKINLYSGLMQMAREIEDLKRELQYIRSVVESINYKR